MGILWQGKYDWGWLATASSHILECQICRWGPHSKTWLGVIFFSHIFQLYRIKWMGGPYTFVGNNWERNWGTRSHIRQSYIRNDHMLESHFQCSHLFFFRGGSPRICTLPKQASVYLALDNHCVVLRFSSKSLNYENMHSNLSGFPFGLG